MEGGPIAARALFRLRGLLGLLAVLVLVAHTAEADEAGRDRLRAELLRLLAASEPDSARTLIHRDPVQSRDAIEYLLGDRARLAGAGQADSARSLLELARSLSSLYQQAYTDSLCLAIVAFHASMTSAHYAPTAAAWTRLREARGLFEQSKWLDARALIPPVLEQARFMRDPYLEEQCLRLESTCLFSVGEMDSARAAFERALQSARALNDRVCEVRMLRNIAATYQNQDRYDEMFVAFRRALDGARETGDQDLFVGVTTDMGIQFWGVGQLDSAVLYLERGDSLATQRGLKLNLATILVNLGGVYADLGQTERALATEARGIAIAREAGPIARRQTVYLLLNASQYLAELGRHSEALRCAREAMEVADESGMTAIAVEARIEVARRYAVLGRNDEAIRFLEEALPVMTRIGVPRYLSAAQSQLGDLYVKAERWSEARAAYEAAVETATRGEHRTGIATALAELGAFYIARNELDAAESRLSRARTIADSLRNPLLAIYVRRQVALLHAARGEPARADTVLDAALAELRRHPAPGLEESCLRDKAALARAAHDLHAADSLLALAMNLVEEVRGYQQGEEMRSAFFGDRKSLFVERVSVLAEMAASDGGAAARAFEVAERARARVLLDLLSPGGTGPPAAVEPRLLEREGRLSARIAKIQEEITRTAARDQWDSMRVDSLESSLRVAVRELDGVREEISTQSPRFGALAGTREPLSLADIRTRVLAPHQVLLEYLVGKDETFLFAISPERERFVRIPRGGQAVASDVNEFRRLLLDDTAGDSLRAAGRSLFERLLGPVASDLAPGSSIVVVPDASLFYLPFEALVDGDRYLVEDHAVAYAPSASVLDPELRSRDRRPRAALLAVGNPHTYREEALLASSREGERWRWGELPFAADEVNRVARYFKRTASLTGVQATEEAVKAGASGASCLHFATHGLLDEREPLLSGLALAQDDDPAEDGILQTYEILRMNLSADLAVLSGCNTGLGRLADGEGVLGLTRAFLHAGARALLISLWEVNDRSTPDLMDDFYRARFEKRLPADRALQSAKLGAIARGAPARDWAAFCLVGDATLPLASTGFLGSPRVAMIGALLLVAGAILLVGSQIRKRAAA